MAQVAHRMVHYTSSLSLPPALPRLLDYWTLGTRSLPVNSSTFHHAALVYRARTGLDNKECEIVISYLQVFRQCWCSDGSS